MKVPEGFQNKDGLVCKLKKALYGLKQAPRAWNKTIDNFLSELDFVRSEVDKCLYSLQRENFCIFLILYVDDILLAGNNQCEIDSIKDALKGRFNMKDLGPPKSFLGIKIEQTNEGLRLSQRSYFEKLLQRFEMDKCNPIATPMDSTPIAVNNEEIENDLKLYRELVGCLMYGMLDTRPDLSFAVNYFSRYQHEQTESRWKGLKRILRYIKGTWVFIIREQERF